MSERTRRDGRPTAHELKARAEACAGFTASGEDPEICSRCGSHLGHHSGDDGVDDLSRILPPDGRASAEEVEARQAEAIADSAHAGGPPPAAAPAEKLKTDGYTYEEAQADMKRLGELDEEQQKINRERSNIYTRMEKRGTNKAVFRSLIALSKKSAATIEAEEAERRKLFGWMISPKLGSADKDAEA